MTDPIANAIDVLNGLLAAEARSLVRRLGESKPFVTWGAEEESEIVTEVIADHSKAVEAITGEIVRLAGSPDTPSPDLSTADLHYLDLEFLLPQILADQEAIVGAYESAAAKIPAALSSTTGLVGDLLTRHREHVAPLDRLRKLPSSGARSG